MFKVQKEEQIDNLLVAYTKSTREIYKSRGTFVKK